MLFDLNADPWERDDLAAAHPEIVARLKTLYAGWNAQNADPLWLDPHGENVHKEEATRQAAVDAASRGQR